jgi:hypothetical protein
MATATRENNGRVVLMLSRHEAEVLRSLVGHLSFSSPGTDEASSIFAALRAVRVERAYDVDISKTPTGSFHLVGV